MLLDSYAFTAFQHGMLLLACFLPDRGSAQPVFR